MIGVGLRIDDGVGQVRASAAERRNLSLKVNARQGESCAADVPESACGDLQDHDARQERSIEFEKSRGREPRGGDERHHG